MTEQNPSSQMGEEPTETMILAGCIAGQDGVGCTPWVSLDEDRRPLIRDYVERVYRAMTAPSRPKDREAMAIALWDTLERESGLSFEAFATVFPATAQRYRAAVDVLLAMVRAPSQPIQTGEENAGLVEYIEIAKAFDAWRKDALTNFQARQRAGFFAGYRAALASRSPIPGEGN